MSQDEERKRQREGPTRLIFSSSLSFLSSFLSKCINLLLLFFIMEPSASLSKREKEIARELSEVVLFVEIARRINS